jgi:hypothetical protein
VFPFSHGFTYSSFARLFEGAEGKKEQKEGRKERRRERSKEGKKEGRKEGGKEAKKVRRKEATEYSNMSIFIRSSSADIETKSST